jgi:hypothetical protein
MQTGKTSVKEVSNRRLTYAMETKRGTVKRNIIRLLKEEGR